MRLSRRTRIRKLINSWGWSLKDKEDFKIEGYSERFFRQVGHDIIILGKGLTEAKRVVLKVEIGLES